MCTLRYSQAVCSSSILKTEVPLRHMSPDTQADYSYPLYPVICRRLGFNPWVGKIPWRREWQPTPVFLPGESQGQRSLVGYGAWGCKELDTTERLMQVTYKIAAKCHRHVLPQASQELQSWKVRDPAHMDLPMWYCVSHNTNPLLALSRFLATVPAY